MLKSRSILAAIAAVSLLIGRLSIAATYSCVGPAQPSSCGANFRQTLTPSHLHSSAVFLTCNPESRYSGGNLPTCRSVANAILDLPADAVLNLVVKSSLANTDPDLVLALHDLKVKARASNRKLNIIRTKTLPGDFARDAGVVMEQRNGPVVSLVPDIMGGARAMREALNQCRDLSTDYVYARSFAATVSLLINDVYNRDPEARDRVEADRFFEGGNIIGLPGGRLLVGERSDRSHPSYVTDYFDPKGIVAVQLPDDVGVGHIDEFFNLVPPRDPKCGFAILAASPAKLAEWSVGPIATLPADGEFDQSSKTRSWKTLLEDPFFSWQVHQKIIDAAKDQIWTAVRNETKCSKNEIFVDVPMGWNSGGRPYFSNPINGLHLNGYYLMPEPYQKIAISRDQSFSVTPQLREMLRDYLKVTTGLQDVITVDTLFNENLYFGTGGSVHCLTLNIPKVCPSPSTMAQ